MWKWLRFDILIILIFMIGVSQYATVAVTSALQGDVVLWQMETAAMEGSGWLRYVKDGFLLLLSISWPLYLRKVNLPHPIARMIRIYSFWMLCVVIFGAIGIIVEYSPFLFLTAGMRWLLLLHASFGVFVLMASAPNSISTHHNVMRALLVMAAFDLTLILMQYATGQSSFGLGFGQSRLTGLFNNAGVAGFFGFALAMVGMQLDGASNRSRFLLAGASLVIALSSGTRSISIFVFLILSLQTIEYFYSSSKQIIRKLFIVFIIPTFFLMVVLGYQWMIDLVDRGGILEIQLQSGGRISNFINMTGVLLEADVGEFLFGRGLGVGTNTAHNMLLATGISPYAFRFNWLIDNAFLTQFFQLGLLGSALFWVGVLIFAVLVRPPRIKKYRRRYWLTCILFFAVLWAGNPFEHYLLMLPFSISLGCSYWGARAHFKSSPQTKFREQT